jgi:hypothetical protein
MSLRIKLFNRCYQCFCDALFSLTVPGIMMLIGKRHQISKIEFDPSKIEFDPSKYKPSRIICLRTVFPPMWNQRVPICRC